MASRALRLPQTAMLHTASHGGYRPRPELPALLLCCYGILNTAIVGLSIPVFTAIQYKTQEPKAVLRFRFRQYQLGKPRLLKTALI